MWSPERRAIEVSWPSVRCHVVSTVHVVRPGVDVELVENLTADLDDWSGCLWADDHDIPDLYEDVTFGDWLDRIGPRAHAAIRDPYVRQADGTIGHSYSMVVEYAHSVGRCLLALGDDAIAAAIDHEVADELAAARAAYEGRFDQRSFQGTKRTTVDVDPSQVLSAHRVLLENPAAHAIDLSLVNPTSACVAAAHWLFCAASVAGEVLGTSQAEVIHAADYLEALEVVAPLAVLEGRAAGISAAELVVGMVDGARWQSLTTSPLPLTETPLDPRRPGRDLLGRLISAIDSCYMVAAETLAGESDHLPDIDVTEEAWVSAFNAELDIALDEVCDLTASEAQARQWEII